MCVGIPAWLLPGWVVLCKSLAFSRPELIEQPKQSSHPGPAHRWAVTSNWSHEAWPPGGLDTCREEDPGWGAGGHGQHLGCWFGWLRGFQGVQSLQIKVPPSLNGVRRLTWRRAFATSPLCLKPSLSDLSHFCRFNFKDSNIDFIQIVKEKRIICWKCVAQW